MKKNIILSAALMLFTFIAQAQTTITFDENDYKKISVYDQWEESPFREGGALEGRGRAAVTNNPYAEEVDPILGEVLNSTANVLALQRSRHGGNAFGVRIDLKEPLRMTKDFQYIHVMTYLKDKPAPSRMMVIGLGKRIEDSWNDQPEDVEQFWALTTNEVKAQDGWQDVVVKFNGFSYAASDPENGSKGINIYSLVIVPDVRSPHADEGDWVAYFDDVKVDNSPVKRFTSEKYALSVDKEAEQPRTDRHLNAVGLTVSDKRYSSSARTQKLYTDNTTTSMFSATAGDQVQPTFDYTGGIMHGFVYVDWDNNGVFQYDGEGSEVVSYKQDDVRQGVPAFTIPEGTQPGLYRMRYKVDWNSLDPAGNDAENNKIVNNGGGILDLMLDVHAAGTPVSVNASQLNGNIWDDNGEALATAAYGEPLKVRVVPADGFVQYGFTLRYGYNVSAPEQLDDNGNPHYLQVEVPYSAVAADGTYTIPGEYIRGNEVSLEGNMQGEVRYTVEITGDGGKGGVEYAHTETKNGGTIYATQYLTAEQLTPTPVERLVAEVSVNKETHVITVAYEWEPPTRVSAINTEKFYTLRCKADKHGNVLTGRYIGDNREVIDGHSEEGTPIRFIEGESENTYYMQSVVSDRFINVAVDDNNNRTISVSTEKSTAWTFNVPSGNDYDGTVTFGVAGDYYLNNVDDNTKGVACANLKPNCHSGGPGTGNACSLWYLDEYNDLDRFVVEYTVKVTGATDGGVIYGEETAIDGGTIAIPLSLTAQQVKTVALDGYKASEVTIDKASGTILVTYQPCTPAQWDFTFNRTSTTEATVAVTRDGEVVEGVTATIAMSTDYKANGKLASERTDLLCSTTNSSVATADTPIKYTLTITNNTDKICLFDYIEVSNVALNGDGNYQTYQGTNRVRNFKVTYGEETIDPEKRYICDNNHLNGKDYPQGFGAKMSIPAGETYTIELAIYGGGDITGDEAAGCFYGLSKIALGAVPHYAVTVEGTEDAEGGVVYGNTTYNEGSTLNATLSLAQSELAAAPVEGYLGSVALDKALGTILVTYQEVVAAQWDFTFNRTATSATIDAATVTVATGGVAVADVTATILPNRAYKVVSNRADVLCLDKNTGGSNCATAEDPNRYTLVITNNSDINYTFDYIEVSGLAVNGSGSFQPLDVDDRMRNFKVTYGNTSIGPKELYICKKNIIGGGGKVYPHGFGAKMLIPAHSTYTIEVEVYNITHDSSTLGNGCFYGLSKIALGNTAVSFGTTGYATLYAPIALTIPEGVTAYTGALDENNTWLTLTPIEGNTIPKEHAVILEGTAGNKFTLEEATEAGTDVSNNALKGQTSTVATSTVITDTQEPYTLQSHEEYGVAFKRFVGDNLAGGKAYLLLTKVADAQQAPAVRIRFADEEEGEGGTTAIDNEQLTIDNSQFTIYDLQGRRVLNPTKGMYIVNGKKIVIK